MTRVLAGIGEMLQARSMRRIYWVHAIWILNLFLVIAWWIFYRWRNIEQWTYFLFLFVLISPTICISRRSFSSRLATQGQKPRTIIASTFTRIIAVFLSSSAFPVDVADTLLKGTAHFVSLGPNMSRAPSF